MQVQVFDEGPGIVPRFNPALNLWEVRFRLPQNVPVFGMFSTYDDAMSYANAQLGIDREEKKQEVKTNPETVPQSPKKTGTVEIWTDGSNRGQPGPGGWAAILICGEHYKELSGRLRRVTNNQAEVQAVIEGLKAVNGPRHIEIVTDSQYVAKGVNHWIYTWARHGWEKPNKNREQWQELHNLIRSHKSVTARWVRGHSGEKHNERADELAGQMSREEKERQSE